MPEFHRIDGFARTPDGTFSRRDLTRLLNAGFDIAPTAPPVCPPPGLQRFFRIDEFAVAADGRLDARDRTRFTSIGFDIEPTVPAGNITIYVNAPGVSVLIIIDQDILKEIQLTLVEDPVDSGLTFTSGLWTAQEVIDYLNQRQAEFLKLTSLVMRRSRIPTVPQVQRYPLPTDWISTQRASFVSPGGRRKRSLHRVDHLELDHLWHDWQHASAFYPRAYNDSNLPTHTIEIAPQAKDGGVIELLYVGLGTALSNTGVPFTVPVEFVAPIKWGVLANMLGKVGRANDPRRAEYCEQRFREGVEAAKVLLQGFS